MNSAAAGWTISDEYFYKSSNLPTDGVAWGRDASHSMRINVEGYAKPLEPPLVPRNVGMTLGDNKLTMTWEAPSSWGSWNAKGYTVSWNAYPSESEWRVGIGGTLTSLSSTSTSYEFSGPQNLPNDNWEDAQGQLVTDLWGGNPNLAAGSLSSAAVLTLDPGNYTAKVAGKDGTTGVALVEVYDLD